MGLRHVITDIYQTFSKIAEPLIALPRKHAMFKWTLECHAAFEFLKTVLQHTQTQNYLTTYTDASANCIRPFFVKSKKILMNTEMENVRRSKNLFYFLSPKLSHTQCRYSAIERECYAIYYALQKLHTYLHYEKFEIFCDHQPRKHLLGRIYQSGI